MKKFTTFVFVVALSFFLSNQSNSQQRNYSTGQDFNTTIEYCTGTWCQYCPCGHDIINSIKASYPKVVVLGYHGAGSDPWQSYSLGIRQQFGFFQYPTAVIGRRTGIISRSAWASNTVIQQTSVTAGVQIDASVSFDNANRQVNVQADLTALDNLEGTYRINFVLLESGMVYPQTGNSSCPGNSTYIHNHVVKGMINGDLGEIVHSAGTWSASSIKNVSMSYNLATDVVPENADIAIFVWKQEGALNAGTSHVMNSMKVPVDGPTNISNTGTTVPTGYSLAQNFPNPFNPTTNIVFSIPVAGNVSLKFYDALGNEVSTYLDGFVDAGTYNAHFEATNLPSGIYFYTLRAEGFAETKKMMLLK